VKPNLKGTETPYKWGYVMLASAGSRQWMNLSQPAPAFSPFIPTLLFLIGSGAPVDLADIAGLTALHHVAMNNRIGEVLQILLAAGGDPNKQDRYGCTPLHSAIIENQAEAVDMCLKHDADLEICDNDGYSPFYTVRHADPALHAIVHKHKRLMEGVAAPMEDKGKCVACGKTGSKSQCARCRVARYCSPHCQGEIQVYTIASVSHI
jgi:ankyrin repeat protein